MRYILWLAVVVGALASLGVRFAHEKMPSASFWLDHGGLLMTCILLTAVVPGLQATVVEYGERRRRKRAERSDSVRELLGGGLAKLEEDTGIDWKRAGLNAFLVGGVFRKRQFRLARVKLTPYPQASGVRWTRGKGVIGRCWSTQRFAMHDLRAEFAQHYEADRVRWEALPADARFGLSFDEFQRTRDLYGVIAAVPILDPQKPGKYLGCVSLDTPRDSAEGIDQKKVEEDLGAVAVTIGLLIASQS
jgi:hypothetical protein